MIIDPQWVYPLLVIALAMSVASLYLFWSTVKYKKVEEQPEKIKREESEKESHEHFTVLNGFKFGFGLGAGLFVWGIVATLLVASATFASYVAILNTFFPH